MSTQDLLDRANVTANRLRAAGKNDLANRFCGRAEVVITRHAARLGEIVPTLYVDCDEKWLTTWMGNKIAPIVVTGCYFMPHCRVTCYGVVLEGRYYYGRGSGAGMMLNLKPGKRVA